MAEQVTLHHDGFILGIPASEMQGPGVYDIEGGHVVSFEPLPAPAVEEESLQADSNSSQEEQSDSSSEQIVEGA
jgi:hypothetical protein